MVSFVFWVCLVVGFACGFVAFDVVSVACLFWFGVDFPGLDLGLWGGFRLLWVLLVVCVLRVV